MDKKELIKKFYSSFAAGDSQQMVDCYHDDIIFSDPAFGALSGEAAKAMWKMLIERGKENLNITFKNIQANNTTGSAQWTARYPYGSKKRPVVNNITARFIFEEDKIIEHHDTFDIYKWSKQALGLSGYLLGWTGFMRSKIQEQTNRMLSNYMENKHEPKEVN